MLSVLRAEVFGGVAEAPDRAGLSGVLDTEPEARFQEPQWDLVVVVLFWFF